MADLRIYELTDEQATYSPDLHLMIDDSTFTNTKKVKMSTIYPLIDTLTEATNINPATTEFRVSISAGNEQRMTVNNLLGDSDVVTTLKSELNLNTQSISFTGTPGTGITVTSLNGERRDKLQVIYGEITVASGTPPVGQEMFIRQISGYESPGQDVLFPYANRSTNINEGASGRIDTNGNIYIKAWKESSWVFNVSVIGA